MEKLAVNIPVIMERLMSPSFMKGEDEWDSDGEKSASDLVTSPHSDQSTGVEGVTSSPLSNQSENCIETREASVREICESSSGVASPIDRELREAVDNTVRNLAERLSVSGGDSEGDRTSPSTTANTTSNNFKTAPPSPPTFSIKLKTERDSSPTAQLADSEIIMKEEAVTPSPPVLAPTTPQGPPSPNLSADIEAARQQISSMIQQGLPILSMFPALQRLAPAVVSLASGLGNITTNTSSGSGSNGIMCVCGIRFSSTTNLEAHRMFYCTHRPSHTDNDVGSKETRTPPSSISPHGDADDEEGTRILRCPHCTYTTTHKLSLNGHMNIHTSPEELAKPNSSSQAAIVLAATAAVVATTSTQASGDTRATDRYCGDCDIQFSSVKTFRVHKAHYCQTRHVLKGGNKSPVREEIGSSTSASTLAGLVSAATASGQPILALPTNPILLVPYSLVAGAQLLPPHVLPQAGAAVVLPNGQVQPLSPGSLSGPALPPLLSPPTAATRGSSPAAHNSLPQTSPQSKSSSPHKLVHKDDIRNKANSCEVLGKRRGEGDCPLDLTTKRPKLTVKSDLMNDEEKENREVNTPTSAKSPVPKSRSGSSHGAGEFEGRLLASPPRPSPSGEIDCQSNPRSPRPASAAPTLGSPRGLADSPRPSTSARLPGQHTQVPAGLPQLPPGFPNILAGLESLSSLSLASLQSLQGVPPELALKLLSPDLLMNGLAPMVNPPVIVKQGEAKCNECNIVFYKEESLQVHKKHYCAARASVKIDEDRHSNGSRSPAAASEVSAGPSRRSPSVLPDTSPTQIASASVSVNKESSKPTKPLLQFICSACGIKFTSPDNLAAHQTYYCPKREGASGEDGVTKGLWRCPRCRCAMPETLQAAHQCVTPSPAPSHGWKCPCCPVISPTAAAAQKHLETHAGIKAFRCTICGYRGNTLRGMRTHIRMHFEKRTNDLQEENFIACILEEDDGSTRAAEARGVADLPRVILENPTLSALLAEGAAADRAEQPLSCHFCPFATPFRSNLARHLALAHKVNFDAKLSQDLQALLENRDRGSTEAKTQEAEQSNPVENGNPVSPPPLPAIKLEPEVKLEVEDCDDKIRTVATVASHSPHNDIKSEIPECASSNNNGTETPRHCKACNITFSYLESFLAHKRFYCTKPESTTPPETAVQ